MDGSLGKGQLLNQEDVAPVVNLQFTVETEMPLRELGHCGTGDENDPAW